MNYNHKTSDLSSHIELDLCKKVLLPQIINSYVRTVSYKFGDNVKKWPPILREEFGSYSPYQVFDGYKLIRELNLDQRYFFWEDKKYEHVPFGHILEGNNHFLIVLRGTTGPYEWINNTRFIFKETELKDTKLGLHLGFYELYKELIGVISSLANILSTKKILITGHSLGGAIGQLFALELSEFHPVVYTFGAPRVGNGVFKDLFEEHISESYRIVNYGDVVPELPPFLKNKQTYKHASKAIYIGEEKKVTDFKIPAFDWRKHMPSAYMKELMKIKKQRD